MLEESFMQLQNSYSEATKRIAQYKEEYLNVWADLANTKYENALLKNEQSKWKLAVTSLQEQLAKEKEEQVRGIELSSS